MIRKYTEAEMLSLYKRRLGLYESRTGGVVSRQDGSHVDEYLLTELRGWYSSMLRSTNAELLPVEDVVNEIPSKLYVDESTAEVCLPTRGIRLVGIKLPAWRQEITTFYQPDSDMAMMQRNKYLRAGISHPVVVVDAGKAIIYGVERPKLNLDDDAYPTVASLPTLLREPIEVESLKMVVEPADGEYLFDDSLLLTIH